LKCSVRTRLWKDFSELVMKLVSGWYLLLRVVLECFGV
jgi:hypothetical protein